MISYLRTICEMHRVTSNKPVLLESGNLAYAHLLEVDILHSYLKIQSFIHLDTRRIYLKDFFY